MPHTKHGRVIEGKRKRKNSQPMKNVRCKPYTSPNKNNSMDETRVFEGVPDNDFTEIQMQQNPDYTAGETLTLNKDNTLDEIPEIVSAGDMITVNNEPRPPPAHSNTPHGMHARPLWVEQIFEKLALIDRKLSKVDEMNNKLSEIVQKVNSFECDLNNLKKTSGTMGNSIGTLKRTSDEVKERVGKLEEVHTNLEESIVDLQCRSMRDNLLFFGLAEYRGENRENCTALINDFCETQFDIHDIGKDIERAHRIGQRGGDSPRPIVVKFSSFKMREKVRTQGRKLAGTTFRIQEQFPKKIQEERTRLIPVMNEARRQRKKAYLIKDKLYIEGTLYNPDQNDDKAC